MISGSCGLRLVIIHAMTFLTHAKADSNQSSATCRDPSSTCGTVALQTSATAGKTSMDLTAAGQICYGHLKNLAIEEGAPVGQQVYTKSADTCKGACSKDERCNSFSLCPEWDGCWMKSRNFVGTEASKVVGTCKTYYKKPCNANSPSQADGKGCYKELQGVASYEGDPVGQQVYTTSPEKCKTACDANGKCNSFSFCPQWGGCWMKGRRFSGSEASRSVGACQTYYKTACLDDDVNTPSDNEEDCDVGNKGSCVFDAANADKSTGWAPSGTCRSGKDYCAGYTTCGSCHMFKPCCKWQPASEADYTAPTPASTASQGSECNEAAWPDKDNGLVCGECKVLVDQFQAKYKTCDGYCARLGLGLQCVGAWDEIEDTCEVRRQIGCKETLATSDVICQCGLASGPDSSTEPADRCTATGMDPYSSGNEVRCCAGLKKCLGDWSGTGTFNYKCADKCKSTPTNDVALCGIAPNQGACEQELRYLASIDDRAGQMACMGYGGVRDPCTLSITNDADSGLQKNPAACREKVFFLWDEPDTQCERGRNSCGRKWAQMMWKQYVRKWDRQIAEARARGVKFTSPLMKSGDEASLLRRYDDFFDGCPEFSDPSSNSYIDVIAWNAFVTQSPPSPYDVPGQFSYLKTLAKAIKRKYAGRLVYATNFGVLFANTAADQASAIFDYDIFRSARSQIDGVFYFAAQDYCGKPIAQCTSKNFLRDVVRQGPHAGKTLGTVLIEMCYP